MLLVLPAVAAGQAGSAEQQFKEGYFLQTHEHDFAAAAAAYERVVANADAPPAIRAEAQTRLAQCQEEQAATELARLMPSETVAYFEISRPGKHVGQLLRLLGLVRQSPGGASGTASGVTPLPGGLVLPDDFAVSPALIRELNKIQGLAVAITGIAEKDIPRGVAVIHPGDFDLWRGLIETGVQVLPRGEPIAGFTVYQVEGNVWLAVTNRLFIVSGSRDEIAATITRLKNPQADSLAKESQFRRLEAERAGALVFAYVNGRRALEIARPHMRGQEAMVAQMLLDLEHLESASAVVSTSDSGVYAHAKVVMTEGHRNLAYGLVRTAPVTKRSLSRVPAGAAAVAVLGLNPASKPAEAGATAATPSLTAMDIGREVFSNVEEISLFLMPADSAASPKGIPDVGMIAAVKDPAKSEALWDQLLSLASMVEPRVAQRPKEIEIEGRKAKEYQFADAPPIVVVRLADGAMAAGTRGAVTAALNSDGPRAITGDPQFKPLLDGLRPDSSKAVFVHAGRAFSALQPVLEMRDEEAAAVGSLVSDLRLMVATNEKPAEFMIQATASGLPNVPQLIKTAIREDRPAQRAATRVRAPVRSVVPERPAAAK
jgi:hypothetical protein